jgi:large subunit ribosomal protein L2
MNNQLKRKLLSQTLKIRKERRKLLHKGGPEPSLTVSIRNTGGRNIQGRITNKNMSGMNKRRKLRIEDKTRQIEDVVGVVERIEHNPHTNAFLALIQYPGGRKAYITSPHGMRSGDEIMSGPRIKGNIGDCAKLKDIDEGKLIHNIELSPGSGAKIVRAAGTFAKILGKEADFVKIQLPSKEVRRFSMECRATIGIVSNPEAMHERILNAGAHRHMGRKPHVRGVAMNPIDHHNGGRTSGGKILCSESGKMRKGHRTRKKNKFSDCLIEKRRR